MSYELFVVPPLVTLAWIAGLVALASSSPIVRALGVLVAALAGGAVFWIYTVDGSTIWSAPQQFEPPGGLASVGGWDRVVAEARLAWEHSHYCGRLLPWLIAAAAPSVVVGLRLWMRERARPALRFLAGAVAVVALYEVVSITYAAVVFASPYARGTWPMEVDGHPHLSDVRWSFGYVEEALAGSDSEERTLRCRWLEDALADQILRAELEEHVSAARRVAATTACARLR